MVVKKVALRLRLRARGATDAEAMPGGAVKVVAKVVWMVGTAETAVERQVAALVVEREVALEQESWVGASKVVAGVEAVAMVAVVAVVETVEVMLAALVAEVSAVEPAEVLARVNGAGATAEGVGGVSREEEVSAEVVVVATAPATATAG
jgi:hypothetical protein